MGSGLRSGGSGDGFETESAVSDGGTSGSLLVARTRCGGTSGVELPDVVGGLAKDRAGSPGITVLVGTRIVFGISSDGGQSSLAVISGGH